MTERSRARAAGIAAGAAVAAGAAAVLGRGALTKKARRTLAYEAAHPDEETSGRGQPAGGPDPESRESGHDVKDASVSALVKVIAFSLATMVASLAIVFYMYSRFDRAFQNPNGDLTVEQRAPIVPPLPHLQAQPFRDIDAVLMEQTQRLTTYGWTGSDHKGAHIPIERAIQQVIGKPLDAPATTDAAGPKGSQAPQQATPAYGADLPEDKPANHVQGEANPDVVAPQVTHPLVPGSNP